MIEIITVLAISSIIISSSSHMYRQFQNIDFRVFQYTLTNSIQYSRHYAISRQKRTSTIIEKNVVIIKSNNQILKKIGIPKDTKCQQNGGMDFTNMGTARKSGSITCTQRKMKFKITLGIGLGKLEVYD